MSFSDEDAEDNNDNIFDQEDDDLILEKFAGMRKSSGGYTPFEFIEFSNIVLKHEVSIRVKAPPSHCYQVWHNRCNWMEWFDLIDEMGFHEEDRNLVSMYLWYRWALTPFLELYLTLGRTKDEENKYIVEEPVEGMPLVAAVLFQQDDGSSTDNGTDSGTVVTLRVGYQLPKVLYEFAGKLAVYADVDEKLRVAMKKMKGFAEGVDPTIVANMAQEAEAQITQGFMEQRGNDARSEERTRLKESQKTQAAAAAAAARAALAEADPTALEEKKQSQQQGGVDGVTALGMSSIDHEEEEEVEEEEEDDTDVEGEEGDENDGEHSAAAITDDEGKRLGRPKGTLNKHPKFPTSKDLTELRKRT